jgi:hypothetical protein
MGGFTGLDVRPGLEVTAKAWLFRQLARWMGGTVPKTTVCGDCGGEGGTMTTDSDDIAEAFNRLKRAGWSIGDVGFAPEGGVVVCLVTGRNGENVIRAEGISVDVHRRAETDRAARRAEAPPHPRAPRQGAAAVSRLGRVRRDPFCCPGDQGIRRPTQGQPREGESPSVHETWILAA